MIDQTILYEQSLRVNAFECDINRRWKPAAFFQHLTETAGTHADILGCGFDAMFAKNMFWVHSRMKIKFLSFPLAGNVITIRTWPKTIQQKLFFIRDYVILASNGTRLATATSAWLVISTETRRMVMPGSLAFNIPSLPERSGLDEPLDRLGVVDGGIERLRVGAGYSSVDVLGHVNNSRYVEWICDSFPFDDYRQRSLDWMQINYDKEILPGEEVSIRSQNSDSDPALWSVEGRNVSNGTRAFEAMVRWKE
jgi:acyl-ACP thioesterase